MTKAFLLGAGLGTRLRPLTDALPKPLIPVLHRPLITYALDRCLDAGIREFAINTHHLPHRWHDLFPPAPDAHPLPPPSPNPPSSSPPTRSTYRHAPVTFFHEPVLLETGGGLKNLEFWIGDDPILVHNGDILAAIDLDLLISTHLASGDLATLALRSHGPNLHVALHGSRITDIRRLLDTADGTHQFLGVYCISPALLRLIPTNRKISVIPAFLELAREGALGACVLDDGPWLDLGSRDTYLAAHFDPSLAPLASTPPVHPDARVHPSATIESSAVGPGARIGPGARLRHSVVWPGRQIEPDARLTDCIVFSSTPVSGTHHQADL